MGCNSSRLKRRRNTVSFAKRRASIDSFPRGIPVVLFKGSIYSGPCCPCSLSVKTISLVYCSLFRTRVDEQQSMNLNGRPLNQTAQMPSSQKLMMCPGQQWGSSWWPAFGGIPFLNPEIPFSPAQPLHHWFWRLLRGLLRWGTLKVWDLQQSIREGKLGTNVLP